ncbi:PrsW family intramembrane metalloprotease, partial [Streptomyces pilosus]
PSLAFLRPRGRRGRAGTDFAARERELLLELWHRRGAARPALDHAARLTAPPAPVAAAPWPPPHGHPPYAHPPYGPLPHGPLPYGTYGPPPYAPGTPPHGRHT